MLNAIRQTCQDYYNQLPRDTARTVLQSAMFSFTAALLIVKGKSMKESMVDYTRPLIASGVAALAATIHALATPFFNTIFGNSDQVTFYQEAFKVIIVRTLTNLLVYYASARTLNFITSQFLLELVSTNMVKSGAHLVPRAIDFLFNFNNYPAERARLRSWGLDTPDGANTTYLVLPHL